MKRMGLEVQGRLSPQGGGRNSSLPFPLELTPSHRRRLCRCGREVGGDWSACRKFLPSPKLSKFGGTK